jgi:hypothetical protein
MDKEYFSPLPLGWIARHVFQQSIYSLPTAEKEIAYRHYKNKMVSMRTARYTLNLLMKLLEESF